jgi:tetratricopeptide (TPR) repeat protein
MNQRSMVMLGATLAALLAAGAGAAQTPQEAASDPERRAAVELLPLSPESRARLTDLLAERKFDDAEQLLVEKIEQGAPAPRLLTFLAGVFFQDGKYLNAAIALKKAEAIEPLAENDRFLLVLTYVTLNHRDWARPEIETLIRNFPRNPLYPYWLGRLDYDAMHFEAAERNFNRTLELDPVFMRAYDNLGLTQEALGKFDKAIGTYEQAIRLNRNRTPSSPWPPLNLGALFVKLNRLEEAEKVLRESLSYDPEFPQAHYQLGLALEKQKKDLEALASLEAAIQLDPDYPEPHFVLGRIYRRLGETKKAEVAWSRFEKLRREKREIRPR